MSISRRLSLIAVAAMISLTAACSNAGFSTEPGASPVAGPRHVGYTVTADGLAPQSPELDGSPADSLQTELPPTVTPLSRISPRTKR